MKTGTKIFLSIVGLLVGVALGLYIWSAIRAKKQAEAAATGGGAGTTGGAGTGSTKTPNSNPVTDALDASKPINPDKTATSTYKNLPDGDFPIKKGSKNKLTHLFQHLLNTVYTDVNLEEDGVWGSSTEALVKSRLGVSQIDKATAKSIYVKIPAQLASSFTGYSNLVQAKILK